MQITNCQMVGLQCIGVLMYLDVFGYIVWACAIMCSRPVSSVWIFENVYGINHCLVYGIN
jgi:hypothetical protein